MSAIDTPVLRRRDPRLVSYFRPYEAGDVVEIAGKDWMLVQGMHGWSLCEAAGENAVHNTIRDVRDMLALIGLVERAFLNGQLIPA